MDSVINRQSAVQKKTKCLITIILLLISGGTFLLVSQEKQSPRQRKKIELIYCDELIIDKQLNKDLQRLIGNVALRHNQILMTCDSAYLYQELNQVKAYGNVKINQADTISISGNYLFYDGNEEKGIMEGNVELSDKESKLFTALVNYDVNTRVASYPYTGRIINGKNELFSKTGIYYSKEKRFHFKDSVRINNPDYTLKADTLEYNTETETAFFKGPSVIEGDSLYLYCEKGWYDTRNDISSIWQNALIDNRKQVIRGDSLFYDRKKGFGEAFRNISITDTVNSVMAEGEYAWYYKEPERFLVTGRALFTQFSENDSLYLHADTITMVTLQSLTDTTEFRLMRAFHGCRVYSTDLQARCDSLSYSFQDSVIRLYYFPVLWSEENQLTADSMAIFSKNRKTDRLELYNNVFVAGQVDSLRYNQIKGRKLTGYFENNKLYRILIEGNGETIYFMVDNDELLGVNHARSSSVEILVEEGKIKEIIEHQNPEGRLDPPGKDPPQELRLKGFAWYDDIRPKKKSDVFLKYPGATGILNVIQENIQK